MEDLTLAPTSPVKNLMDRRSAVRLLSLVGLGLFAGTSRSEAFMSFLGSFDSGDLNRFNLPPDWVSALGPNLSSYAQFVDKIRLKNVTVRQIIEPHMHVRGGVHNTLPPRAMWGNIRSTMKVVDSLADRLDMRVSNVISVYRCPAYNAKCPGAKSSSYHMRNNAMDVVFNCSPGKVSAMARAMRSTGLFKGGVGRYADFTHVDTRGSNVDWQA